MIFVKHLLLVAFISFPFVSIAQRNKQTENKVFNHLDIALTAGTTGLGMRQWETARSLIFNHISI